ncbi:serine/threonine-protein phosphatase 6 regulatory ankyrin repeat subunit B [Biomphalaria pfeifferi]|uniref:Serine/threonine-protein phosphatase 6 regulatory ankyrin repeat subunit B n=1 Tax=Biomphalaria pfeifferi TaxID=112525 RepID=A0AAD8B5I8_BIOPF|nr:serine/threonine-protein phosphatase 6 regulatory ankyrin repeat subunit B [Biomphalaria pfeifferi]
MADVDAHILSEHINALHLEYGGDLDIILKSRIIIETLENTHMSVLNLACYACNIRLVTLLLEQGTNVNAQGEDGMPPLHVLCQNKHFPHFRVKIAEMLLEHNLNVDLKDSYGNTALHVACLNSQIDMVNFLIKAGCDVNIPDDDCDTPFIIACRVASDGWYFWNTECWNEDCDDDESSCQKVENFPPVLICKALIKAGANPGQATLLPAAVLYSSMDTVKEFIDQGMDVNMMDEGRRFPLGNACSASYIPFHMVKLLLESGADVIGDGRKNKPIISAYVYNSADKIRLLLSFGAIVSCEEMSDLFSISLSKWFLENPDVIDENSSELLCWKLLLKAGFRPKLFLLANKLKYLSLCSSYAKVSPWLYELLAPLPSLSDICRVSIRAQLKLPIDTNIDNLPLPNGLKGFLKFNEFSSSIFLRSSIRNHEPA